MLGLLEQRAVVLAASPAARRLGKPCPALERRLVVPTNADRLGIPGALTPSTSPWLPQHGAGPLERAALLAGRPAAAARL